MNLKPPLAKMFLAAFSSLSKVIRQFGQWRVRSAFGYVLDPDVAHFALVPHAATWKTGIPSHLAL